MSNYEYFCNIFGVEPTCEDCGYYSPVIGNNKRCTDCDGASNFTALVPMVIADDENE